MAGKFHWLLGLALPCSASSTLDESQSWQCLIFSKQGTAPVQGSVFGPRLSFHVLLLGQLTQSTALNTGYRLTALNLPSPAQTFLADARLERPSPLNHLCLDVRVTLQLSMPKMGLLVFLQTRLPQPFPYSILPSAQVNALKSSVTLPSHPRCIQNYCELRLQNMPQIQPLSPLPDASSLA